MSLWQGIARNSFSRYGWRMATAATAPHQKKLTPLSSILSQQQPFRALSMNTATTRDAMRLRRFSPAATSPSFFWTSQQLTATTVPHSLALGWNAPTTVRTFASKKHKLLLKHAKGYRGRSKNCFRIAIRRVHKAWQYAYRDRRNKKREWRKLWIIRINAALRQYKWPYSRFINIMGRTGVALNRKVLAELAVQEPFAMKSIVDVVDAVGPKGLHASIKK